MNFLKFLHVKFSGPLLVLLLAAVPLFGAQISDTLVMESDSSGPFHLPPYFFFDSTITVKALDSTVLPPWRYFPYDEAIRFQTKLPEGTPIEISYSTEYGKLKRDYSLFKPVVFDTGITGDMELPEITPPVSSTQNITFNGEKSVGVHLGQSGEFSIDQSLDVQFYGDIGDSTRISANISDQSTSLEGDTKEIGEIDRIYLTVANPKWEVTAGDLELKTDSTGILKSRKAPKGIAGKVRGEWGEASLFGAISGHRLAVEYLSGVSGVQSGSYQLKGNGEAGQILPIEGTVELTVQGKKLTEGARDDYTVDYVIGQIRFNPSYTVLDGDVIEIRYRYREYNYSKLVAGVGYEFTDSASPLRITTAVIVDNDNINSNEVTLTDAERDSLKNSGDRAPQILSGRKVHPNDVVTESVRNRLYQLDFENARYYWESSPEGNAHVKDLYLVSYTPVDSGGEYLPYSDNNRELFTAYDSLFLDSAAEASSDSLFLEQVFLYVGPEKGTHSAYHTAPLPERTVQGEIHAVYEPSDQVRIDVAIAGKNRDRNTLSAINDDNNNSGAFRSNIFLSTPGENWFTLSSDIDAEFAGSQFTSDLSSRYDLEREWGIPVDSSRYGFTRGTVTGDINSKAALTAGGGVSSVENDIFSHILMSKLQLTPVPPLLSSYKFQYRESDAVSAIPGRRQEFTTTLTFPAVESDLFIEEEWFRHSPVHYTGYAKGVFSLNFPRLNWENSLEYKRKASGEKSHYEAQEVGHHTLWEQSFEKSFRDAVDISLNTSLLTQKGENEGTSLLLHLNQQGRHLDNRIATELNYSITSENATTRRWQYIYVGQGVGTHVKDPITGEFLPAPFGDYIAEEVILWGDNSKRTVQNGFNYRWSYKSPFRQSISDGLQFSGTLLSQEDIVPHKKGITAAWIPLVTTFKEDSEDTITYSTISYTQGIEWFPPLLKGFSTNLTGTVLQKLDLESRIRRIEGTGIIRKEWHRFNLQGGVSGLREKRNEITIRDANVKPVQEFPFAPAWTLFLEESVGFTALEDTSGNYYAVRPGIRFAPKNAGTAEFSYTAAYLDYRGHILYPMANEYNRGKNHRFYLTLNLNAKKHLIFTGFFRADYTEQDEWRAMSSLRATIQI